MVIFDVIYKNGNNKNNIKCWRHFVRPLNSKHTTRRRSKSNFGCCYYVCYYCYLLLVYCCKPPPPDSQIMYCVLCSYCSFIKLNAGSKYNNCVTICCQHLMLLLFIIITIILLYYIIIYNISSRQNPVNSIMVIEFLIM